MHLPAIAEAADPQPAEAEAATEAMSTYAYNQLVEGINKARKDVEAEARENQDTNDLDQQNGIDMVANAMADIIADDDPYFDREGFLQATGTLLPAVEAHPNETGWTGR